jgi:hypothetical protein
MFPRNDFVLKTRGAAVHDDVRCFVVVLCSHTLESGAQNTGKAIAIGPD